MKEILSHPAQQSQATPIPVLLFLQFLRRECELRRPRLQQLRLINHHTKKVLVAYDQLRAAVARQRVVPRRRQYRREK